MGTDYTVLVIMDVDGRTGSLTFTIGSRAAAKRLACCLIVHRRVRDVTIRDDQRIVVDEYTKRVPEGWQGIYIHRDLKNMGNKRARHG